MLVRKAIEVSGIVQGVGFRPYIYRLASERQLVGSICNTAAGVSIEVQGPSATVDDFLARLPVELPPLARITDIAVREIPCNGDREFQIITTHRGEPVRTLISPDVAVCARLPARDVRSGGPPLSLSFHQLHQLRPTLHHRAQHPVRPPFHVDGRRFTMCPACQAEYEDPRNRRFHAQPNACWTCGPQVELWNLEGKRIEVADPIAETAARLQRGEVVAIKGLGGFHLACDAPTLMRCAPCASVSGASKNRLR